MGPTPPPPAAGPRLVVELKRHERTWSADLRLNDLPPGLHFESLADLLRYLARLDASDGEGRGLR